MKEEDVKLTTPRKTTFENRSLITIKYNLLGREALNSMFQAQLRLGSGTIFSRTSRLS